MRLDYAACVVPRTFGRSVKYVSERHNHSTGPRLKRDIHARATMICRTKNTMPALTAAATPSLPNIPNPTLISKAGGCQ